MKNLVTLLLVLVTAVNLSFAKSEDRSKLTDKTTEAIETVYNDAKSTLPHISNALKSLGEELKIGATAVWEILVRQQLVWSIAFLGLTLSSIFNWATFLRIRFKKAKEEDFKEVADKVSTLIDNPSFCENFYNEHVNKLYTTSHLRDPRFNRKIIVYNDITKFVELKPKTERELLYETIHFIICIIMTVFSVYFFRDMLTGFINPEFGAMKTIVDIAESLNK